MSKHILRGIAALVGAFSLAFVPIVAQAAPTLNWTDISGQLTTRTNRPVWAMAYASPYWFYTDGQDLWNGGQVYRYDGQTQVNITTDVRNAGLSRVDDIVSDGQSVLFLQNTASRNNQIITVSYVNGSYTNLSSTLRNSLNSDEGLVQIVGNNGTWYIITTKLRFLRWNGNTSSPYQIPLPQTFQANLTTINNDSARYGSSYSAALMTYCPHSVEGNYCSVNAVPLASGYWLFTVAHSNYKNSYLTGFPVVAYRYDGSNFTDITPSLNNAGIYYPQFSSNGSSALVVDVGMAGGQSRAAFVTNSNVQALTLPCFHNYWTVCDAILSGKGFWTGTEWLVFGSKQSYSVQTDGTVAFLGESRDYFVTGASNGSGTLLLGGAVSTLGNSQPTNPLIAKLAKVTEGTSTSNSTSNTTSGGGQTAYSTNGPTLTTTGNPSNFRVGQGGTFIYRATASDPNGVDRIDIFANGVIIKTCYADTCEFSTQYYTNGQTTRSIPLSARAWDRLGNPTQLSTNDYLTVDANSTATANSTSNTTTNTTTNTTNQTANGIASWTWFDPNQSFIRRDQNVTFNVGAWDADGLNRIEIWVNGSIVNTCSWNGAKGNQNCSATLWGGNYPLGTVASMNAKITDAKGNVAWTPLQNINVVDVANANTNTNTNTNTTVTTNTNNDSPMSHWAWSSPETATIATNQTVIFTVSAWDADGMRSADFYVNGYVWQTCAFGDIKSSNVTCAVVLNGANWNVGGGVYVNAKLTDAKGNVTWSAFRQYSVVAATANVTTNTTSQTTTQTTTSGSTTNNNNNLPGWVTVSSNHDGGYRTNDRITYTANAGDDNGVNRIELYVDGVLVKTCNAATCSFTSAPVTNRSVTYYGATMYDNAGYSTWTGYKSINKI